MSILRTRLKYLIFILCFIVFFLLFKINSQSLLWSTYFNLSKSSTHILYTPSPQWLDSSFAPPNPKKMDYHQFNAQTLRDLHACILLDNCGLNQRKVALLAAHWFEESVFRGFKGGEGIWAKSVFKNLRLLGYTTLMSTNFEEALAQYRTMPDLVKVIIRNKAGECHRNPQCVKGPNNPTGIPAWKIFDFEFYPSPNAQHEGASAMKNKWILSANPDDEYRGGESPIQYIGYSIEDTCSNIPTVPFSQREDRVWMLMKELTYVNNHFFLWERSYFSRAAEELGISFIGGWGYDRNFHWDSKVNGEMVDIDDGHNVTNLGKLDQTTFLQEMRKSKIMIGMGAPGFSPSPYDALCHAVPFLNPIRDWDENDPSNKTKWSTQHPNLVRYDPPYVYHVHARDYQGFTEAIKMAMVTEIERVIPSHMTEEAVRERLTTLMEFDWRSHAALLLAERISAGGDVYTFEL